MEEKGEMEKCLFCIPNRLHERLHRLHRRLRQDPVAQVENVRRVPRHALKKRACLRPNLRGRSKEDRGLEVALEADSSPEALASLVKRDAPIHAQDARATLGEVREEVRAAIHVKKGWSPFLDGLLKGFFLVGKGKGAEIFRAQEPSPGIEELDRGGAGPYLSRQVAAGHFVCPPDFRADLDGLVPVALAQVQAKPRLPLSVADLPALLARRSFKNDAGARARPPRRGARGRNRRN